MIHANMTTRADEYEKMLQRTWPEFFMSEEDKRRHNAKFENGYPLPFVKERTAERKEIRDDNYNCFLDRMGYRS